MKISKAHNLRIHAALVFLLTHMEHTDPDLVELSVEYFGKEYDTFAERKKVEVKKCLSDPIANQYFSKEIMLNSIDDEFLNRVKEEVFKIVHGLLAVWTEEKPNKV